MSSQSDLQPYPPMASGRLRAWVVVTSARKENVARALQPNYCLAPQTLAPAGEHPVVFIAGKQTNVHWRHHTTPSLSYLEAGVLIPWVQCPDLAHTDTSLFRAVLFLSSGVPKFLGQVLGLTKTHSPMACDQFGLKVILDDEPVFSATFEPPGTFVKYKSIDGLQKLRCVFEQVHVGIPLGIELLPVVCIRCSMRLHKARVRPVQGQLQVKDNFCPAKVGEFRVPPIASEPFGAFELDTAWSMRCLGTGVNGK